MAPRSSLILSMSAVRSFMNWRFSRIGIDWALIWKGIDVCSIGPPNGRVMLCTMAIPGERKMSLASLSRMIMSPLFRMS